MLETVGVRRTLRVFEPVRAQWTPLLSELLTTASTQSRKSFLAERFVLLGQFARTCREREETRAGTFGSVRGVECENTDSPVPSDQADNAFAVSFAFVLLPSFAFFTASLPSCHFLTFSSHSSFFILSRLLPSPPQPSASPSPLHQRVTTS